MTYLRDRPAVIGYLIFAAFVVWGFFQVVSLINDVGDQADQNSRNIAEIRNLQQAQDKTSEILTGNVKNAKKANCLIGQVLSDLPSGQFSIESDADYKQRLRHTIQVLKALRNSNCKALHVDINVTKELAQRAQVLGVGGPSTGPGVVVPGVPPSSGGSTNPILPLPANPPSPGSPPAPGIPSVPAIPPAPGLPGVPIPPILPPAQQAPLNALICGLLPALCN